MYAVYKTFRISGSWFFASTYWFLTFVKLGNFQKKKIKWLRRRYSKTECRLKCLHCRQNVFETGNMSRTCPPPFSYPRMKMIFTVEQIAQPNRRRRNASKTTSSKEVYVWVGAIKPLWRRYLETLLLVFRISNRSHTIFTRKILNVYFGTFLFLKL